MSAADDQCLQRLAAALIGPQPGMPALPSAPSRFTVRQARREETVRVGGNSITRWYAALCAGRRPVFEGFAVMRGGRQIDGNTSTWRKACALADRVGGQVVLWTSSPPHEVDDGGNVGSENDTPEI